MPRKLLLCILALCLLFTGCAQPVRTGETLPPTETAAETLAPETIPPTETRPPETEPEPVTETARAVILTAGDVMMHVPIINSGATGSGYDYDSIFAPIADYVSGADFAAANLETTLAGTENGDVYAGFPKFNCPDALADALKTTGFDLLLTANNHCYDTGAYGMNRTLEVLADRELLSLGTKPENQENPWRIQEINGIQVGMICYTYGEISDSGRKSVNGIPVSQTLTGNINVFDYGKLDLFYQEIEAHIRDMRSCGAEALVLFIHWGNEYQTRQSSVQRSMAQKLCDLGVDVIAGSHPHVIQGMELLTGTADPEHRTLCAYSLGNALSNQRAEKMDLDTGHTEDGVLLRFTFVKYSDGSVCLEGAEVLPTWVHVRYTDSGRIYRILPLDREIGDWGRAFDLGSGDLAQAEASYDRTMEILSPGMEEIDAYFAALRDTRKEADGIFTGGVG